MWIGFFEECCFFFVGGVVENGVVMGKVIEVGNYCMMLFGIVVEIVEGFVYVVIDLIV